MLFQRSQNYHLPNGQDRRYYPPSKSIACVFQAFVTVVCEGFLSGMIQIFRTVSEWSASLSFLLEELKYEH